MCDVGTKRFVLFLFAFDGVFLRCGFVGLRGFLEWFWVAEVQNNDPAKMFFVLFANDNCSHGIPSK